MKKTLRRQEKHKTSINQFGVGTKQGHAEMIVSKLVFFIVIESIKNLHQIHYPLQGVDTDGIPPYLPRMGNDGHNVCISQHQFFTITHIVSCF